MATVVAASSTNNPEIDGLLGGSRWTGTITYSFPDSPNDYPANYYGDSEPTTSGFSAAPVAIQQAIHYAFGLIAAYTNATIQFAGTNGADIAIAQSPAANPTAYAYYPHNVPAGGDIWFGTSYNYSQAQLGNYFFVTALHELGHSLGLKHTHETGGVANVALPAAHDNSEYTVMSYRSYAGAPLTGYTAEAFGYPQTYMANDILALQTLYGADFTTHSGNTVYTWSATTGQQFINGVAQLAPGSGGGGSSNRIFETVWDGNGIDTYDFSNYSTALRINLNPGTSSTTSATQLAYLGNGHYASGNIYNAYLFNGDVRSYIDNATGGSGNDVITGNAIANVLNGGAGNDTLTGGGGNDSLIGGSGTDTAVFSGNRSGYLISYQAGSQTFTVADQRTGSPNGTDTLTGVEYFQFSDGIFASSAFLNPPTVIEAFGSTSLVESGGNFYLNSISSGSGPGLRYAGAAVVAGQFGGWTPIGAEQTATGYQVAWKMTGADQYVVWHTDSNGNQTSSNGTFAGASNELKSLEASFQQDLNGDAVIGLAPVSGTITIESFGSTSLVKAGSNFILDGSGSDPVLKYAGAAVVTGQFGGWTPIGAEQTATGYQVAWKMTGVDQYVVWYTDSNGNQTSSNGTFAGASNELKSLEASFQQDLNSDGIIGLSPVSGTITIESFGSTSLIKAGSNFILDGSGSDPVLKYAGAAVVAGQFGGWTPIGAEQTATGYQVAWKMTGADQYVVWYTDSNGNQTSSNGAFTGASSELKSLEASFQQDLNGDGTIAAAAMAASNDTFVFRADLGADVSTKNADTIGLVGSPAVIDKPHVAALFDDMLSAQPQGGFQWDDHDMVTNPENNDSSALMNVLTNELHANSFIIR